MARLNLQISAGKASKKRESNITKQQALKIVEQSTKLAEKERAELIKKIKSYPNNAIHKLSKKLNTIRTNSK